MPVMAVFIAALLCWFIAMRAAFSIAGLKRDQSFLKTFSRLGRWDFAGIREDFGPESERHIRTYRYAFLGFFVCIIAVMLTTLLIVMAGDGLAPPANSISSSQAASS